MIYLSDSRVRLPYHIIPKFYPDALEMFHRWSISDDGIMLQERSIICQSMQIIPVELQTFNLRKELEKLHIA